MFSNMYPAIWRYIDFCNANCSPSYVRLYAKLISGNISQQQQQQKEKKEHKTKVKGKKRKSRKKKKIKSQENLVVLIFRIIFCVERFLEVTLDI